MEYAAVLTSAPRYEAMLTGGPRYTTRVTSGPHFDTEFEMAARILIGNDHAYRIAIFLHSTVDDTPQPAPGLTVTGFLIDVADGVALTNTTIALTARTGVASTHEYYGYVLATDVGNAIAGKSTIREVFTWAGGRRERLLTVVDPAVDP